MLHILDKKTKTIQKTKLHVNSLKDNNISDLKKK